MERVSDGVFAQRRAADPVPPACGVSDAVGAIEELDLVLVTDARCREI